MTTEEIKTVLESNELWQLPDYILIMIAQTIDSKKHPMFNEFTNKEEADFELQKRYEGIEDDLERYEQYQSYSE